MHFLISTKYPSSDFLFPPSVSAHLVQNLPHYQKTGTFTNIKKLHNRCLAWPWFYFLCILIWCTFRRLYARTLYVLYISWKEKKRHSVTVMLTFLVMYKGLKCTPVLVLMYWACSYWAPAFIFIHFISFSFFTFHVHFIKWEPCPVASCSESAGCRPVIREMGFFWFPVCCVEFCKRFWL